MHRFLGAALLAAPLLLQACASTRIENTWTDPSVAGRPLDFRKVAAIALFEEGALRRVAEDDLARAITQGAGDGGGAAVAIEAVPGYTLLEAGELQDEKQARAKLAAAGVDGAVVVSVIDERQRITSTPGLSTSVGYYGRGWGVLYDTPSVRTDTIVRVQTNLYATEEGKLLWSATTRSYNPDDVSELIGDVVRDVGHALRDEGLIQ